MKLKDIIEEYISGDWGDDVPSDETPHAIYCVRGADIVPISNTSFETIPKRYISEKSKRSRSLSSGDIVIEKSGGSPTQSTGRVCYISDKLVENKHYVVCSNFCCAVRIKKNWNPKFVYYYWQYIYNCGIFFNFEGKTSGLKNLQLENALSAIDIPDMPRDKQDAIVQTLSTYEDKIALNREINRNLEAMARQLYDYWFVQFDFPDENGKPYKSSGGKMVWNEKLKREIPTDWGVCSLGDYVIANNTGDWGYASESDGKTLRVGCIRGADIVKLNDLPIRYLNNGNHSKLLNNWNIVIEVSGGSPVQATGRSAYITPGVIERNGGKITCSNFCHAFTIRNQCDSAFFYYSWQSLYDNGNMFNFEGKTSGIKNFMAETFLTIKWPDIPQKVSTQFFAVIESIHAKIDSNITENNSLTALRDELLPLLINGQVSIRPTSVNCDLSHD